VKRFFSLLLLLILTSCATVNPFLTYDEKQPFTVPTAKPGTIPREAPTEVTRVHWRKNLITAYIDKAIKEDKLIFIFFYNDYCIYCKKMIDETFTDRGLVQIINKKYYAFKINTEDMDEESVERFEVDRVPMVFILKPRDPASKSKTDRIHGYKTSDELFLYLLENTSKL